MAEKGGGISTIGIAAVFAGGVLLWSGIKGYSVSATFRALIAGKSPAVEPSANLVMGESGWNANAANPTSNARGIAQNIQGWGPNYQPGNAAQQIGWMINYIKQRYGTPSNAWAQWQARSPHWY